MSLHVGLSLGVVVDDGRGGGLPHVDRSKRLLLLHRDRLHWHGVVDHLHVVVGETIRGGSVDIGVGHGQVVHFQLFTHLTSLLFSLLGECLVMKEPLEMVLPQCLGSVEVGW